MADQTLMQRVSGAGPVTMAHMRTLVCEGETWLFDVEEALRLDPNDWIPAETKAKKQAPSQPTSTVTMPPEPKPAAESPEVSDGSTT